MAIITGLGGAALALLMQAQAPQVQFNTDDEAATAPCVEPYQDAVSSDLVSDAEWKAIIACVFENTSAQMDTQLPKRVDEITVLVSVSSSGPTFKYVYVLDVAQADVRLENIDSLQAATLDNACSTPNMVQTMGLGGSYYYRWVDRQGTLITTMLIESC